ncbi:MAG: nuclear transport factor 2 family protein [Acidimicrobiia bacterium]
MSAIDIVKALDEQISGGDLEKAGDYMADGFNFVGVGPEPLGKQETLGVWGALRAAMPDFNHNMSNFREAHNIVYGTVEVTGTHTGTLAIPGGPQLAPTNRKFRNPLERVAITVHDGKVTEWVVEQVPGGGVPGILGQLS